MDNSLARHIYKMLLIAKPEEIGTLVSLIKGAGGLAVDLKGNDLGNEDFLTEKTYQLLAGNKDAVKYILNKLK